MNTPWKNRSSKPQLRPSRRAVRPLVEGLETRVVQTVNASITAGHLLVTGDSAGNTITLDHSGTTTLVNGKAFADSAITNGIEIRAGHNTFLEADTINILAMNDATTVDGEGGQINVNVGKSGLVQGVAPLTIQNLGFGGFGSHLSVDNSADPVRRTVTIDGDDSFGSLSGTGGSQIKFSTFALTEMNYFGGGAGNTYNVKRTFRSESHPLGGLSTLNLSTGPGADTVNVPTTRKDATLNIHGQDGFDQVFLGQGGNARGIEGHVSVDNVGDFTNLRIDDSADTSHRDVIINALGTFGLTPASVSYKPSDINILALLGGSGGNTFTIDDTFKAASSASASATIITTGPGNDQVNVRGTTGQLIIDGQSGSDTIDVGNGNNSQNVRGDVSVSNLGGLTALNLHNSADPTGRGVTVDANSGNGQSTVTGLMPAKVSFVANDVKTLGISTGGGVDTYFVRGTQGRTATSLHTGGGNDRVFVGSVDNTLDTIRAPVRVDGEGNADELQIIDNLATGPHTYTQTATSLSRSGAATISYFSIEDLKVFKGPTSGNAPLVKDLQLRESVNAGEVVTLTGVLSDQNKKDKLTLTVDWGDGSAPSVTKPKQKPFAQKHKYTAPGEYTVRVIWSDDTGESNFRDLKVNVTQATPTGAVARRMAGKGIRS